MPVDPPGVTGLVIGGAAVLPGVTWVVPRSFPWTCLESPGLVLRVHVDPLGVTVVDPNPNPQI